MTPAPLGPVAKSFKQCQKCHKTSKKLKSCSRCRRCHYCSVECQKVDWPFHKPICNANCENQQQLKEEEAQNGGIGPGGLSMSELGVTLKKWSQVFRPVLQHSVINALELQRMPDLCEGPVLVLTLKPTFHTAAQAALTPIPSAFMVEDVQKHSISEIRETYPELTPTIDPWLSRSKGIRESGGIGVAFMVTRVGGLGAGQISPYGFSTPIDKEDEYDPGWFDLLKRIVAEGRCI